MDDLDGPGRVDPLALRDPESSCKAGRGADGVASVSSWLMMMVVALPFRDDRPILTSLRSALEPSGLVTALLMSDDTAPGRPSRRILVGRDGAVGIVDGEATTGACGSSVELRVWIEGARDGAGVEAVEMACTASSVG